MSRTEPTTSLYFGFTNPGSRTEGGVYKVKVNASDNFTGELVNLTEAKEYLSDIKTAIKDKSATAITKVGEDLYKALNNRFQAYALEVAWDEKDGEETVVNSVKSTYDIAAANVHPLSYGLDIATGLGENITSKRLPTFSPISDYLMNISNKLQIKVEADDIQYYTIELVQEIGNYYYLVIYDEDGEEIYKSEGFNHQPYEIDKAIVAALNEVNKLNQDAIITGIDDSLQAAIEPLQDLLDRVQKSNKLHYADKLVDIYNKVVGKINNVIANPNHYLQVAAIYSDGQGNYHHLSTMDNMPVQAGNAIELLLTSYTGDVVVPSLYKYVAITAVDYNPATKADNDKAGIYANTVLPGYQHRIALDLSSFAGKLIQLTYVSVDYHGVTSAQNYYIKVL